MFPWDVIIEKGYFIIWSAVKLTADPREVVALFFCILLIAVEWHWIFTDGVALQTEILSAFLCVQ